jgi:hypothetical protein
MLLEENEQNEWYSFSGKPYPKPIVERNLPMH